MTERTFLSELRIPALAKLILPAVEILMVGAIVVFWSAPVWQNWRRPPYASQRFVKIATIKNALWRYRDDHGKLPERLSLLCPQYITADQMDVWFPHQLDVWFPNRDKLTAKLPASLLDISRIDENCDYLYYPRTPIVDQIDRRAPFAIVLCERPYPAAAKTQFAVLPNDLSATMITRQELEASLSLAK